MLKKANGAGYRAYDRVASEPREVLGTLETTREARLSDQSPSALCAPVICQMAGRPITPARGSKTTRDRVVSREPSEDDRVLEASDDVGGAAEQRQHARHLRIGHLRIAYRHKNLQRREADCVPVIDAQSLPAKNGLVPVKRSLAVTRQRVFWESDSVAVF